MSPQVTPGARDRHTFSPHHGSSTLPSWCTGVYPVSTYPPHVHICTIQVPCRLINRLLPSCSNQSHSMVTQGTWTWTSHRSDPWSHTGHGNQHEYYPTPTPTHRMGIPLTSGRRIPVGHPPSASTAPPAAQHKHGGNSEILVDKEEEEKSPTVSASRSVSSKSQSLSLVSKSVA